MSAFSDRRRAEIALRAGYRCEYCHLPIRGQVATFPIDHVLSRSGGGTNEPENLALACPHCNAHKWMAVEGIDTETGHSVRFFNPRSDDWIAHFEWSRVQEGSLIGKTPIGRATIAGLRINDSDMVDLRRLLTELGLFDGELR